MTGRISNIARKTLGLLFLIVGLGTLISGLMIAHVDRAGIHWGHTILSGVLLFVGGWLISQATTEGLADALLKRLPSLTGLWPGGMRKHDPPPEPGVPLPPSVAPPPETK